MTVKERLDAFQKENPPFYIVDHDNGTFSLCLPLDFLNGEYCDYCQDAFDTFAEANGEPHIDDHHTIYGNGYDWQAAFAEAFKDDPNIGRIIFDCEAGGFFCYCDNLDIIEDFGKRFKSICEDYDKFVPIVAEGIRNAEIREAEQERLMKTVKGQLMTNPKATFDIVSPLGEIRVTPEMSKKLLAGEMPTVQIGGVHYADYELLDQPIKGQQTDIFDDNLIRMKTDEAPEPVEAPTMTM